ncbi:MAG: YgfZ/GcvT domain-containing protein [Thermoanaerobaculia bacterium]
MAPSAPFETEPGSAAFRDSTLLFDLTGRAEIAVSGRDRADFLQGLLTNDVKKLHPGEGCAAALLSPKGKMRADVVVLCRDRELLLDAERDLASPLDATLRSYVFFQQVAIESRTETTAVLHVEGEGAEEILKKVLGREGPEAPHASVLSSDRLVVRESRAGFEGFDFRIPRADAARLFAALVGVGAVAASLPLLEVARIEAGIPRWGAELTEAVLPDEAGLTTRGWVSYTKGCYVGQETVARIRTYGHVNRSLVGLLIPLGDLPAPGTGVYRDEQKVGAVTSAVSSTRFSRIVALAYVQRDHAAPGTPLFLRLPSGPIQALVASFPLAG